MAMEIYAHFRATATTPLPTQVKPGETLRNRINKKT